MGREYPATARETHEPPYPDPDPDPDQDQLSSMQKPSSSSTPTATAGSPPSDLGIVMRSLGSNPTESQLRNILARENLHAPFGFNRFMDLMAKYMKPDPIESELQDAFRVLDKDSTGSVSVADLRHILMSIGEKVDPEEFDEWIQEVDVGSDGRFQYEEFIAQLLIK